MNLIVLSVKDSVSGMASIVSLVDRLSSGAIIQIGMFAKRLLAR